MKKLYIINDGKLNGFTYDTYSNMHEELGQLLTPTAFVNVNSGIAVSNIPAGQSIEDWLEVDDTYTPGKKATKSGWVYVKPEPAPEPEPEPEPAKPVEYSVYAWAAKTALAKAGLTGDVEQLIESQKESNPELYYKWHGAYTFMSNDKDLVAMATALGLNSEDLNNLFISARDIGNSV